MEVTLNYPYQAKNVLLDALRDFIPIDIEKFTGSIEIPLKQGNVGVIKYTGHVKVKYKNNT